MAAVPPSRPSRLLCADVSAAIDRTPPATDVWKPLLAPSSKRQPGANLVKLLLSRREGTLDRYLQREATQDLEISRTVEAKYNDRGRAQSCVKVAGY